MPFLLKRYGSAASPPRPRTGRYRRLHWELQNLLRGDISALRLEAVKELKEKGYVIVSVEQADGAVSLDSYVPAAGEKYALVFGHEINGVSEDVVDMSDACIEIPQYGTKHSFNVAVSAGIVLWELTGKITRHK